MAAQQFKSRMVIRDQMFILSWSEPFFFFLLSTCRKPSGHASILVTGGVLEAMNAGVGKTVKLVLNRRKGWIKLALRFGVDLVPSFSFGEHSIYGQVPNPEGQFVQRTVKYFQKQADRSSTYVCTRHSNPSLFWSGVLLGILVDRYVVPRNL